MKKILLTLGLLGMISVGGGPSSEASNYNGLDVSNINIESIESIEDNGNVYNDVNSIKDYLQPSAISTRHNHVYTYNRQVTVHVRNNGRLCDIYKLNKYRYRCGREANGVTEYSYSHYENY